MIAFYPGRVYEVSHEKQIDRSEGNNPTHPISINLAGHDCIQVIIALIYFQANLLKETFIQNILGIHVRICSDPTHPISINLAGA